ncbi:MAG: hypothetical protein HQL88_11150 [Magnetococcales bacterium]|nr:hypothetical protein [Magnetococcales bacterium]
MNDGRIAASQEIIEIVTKDNFNLVWATIDWAIHAERFRLSPEAVETFRRVPHEFQPDAGVLPLLNDWMEQHLRPETRRRIFAEIRRAQFEAAKGAVQIIIAEETQRLLHRRKRELFGPNRGSMEVTIRHLLETEQRALPWQAFRLLEAFRHRHALPGLSEAVRVLIDHAELSYQTQEPAVVSEKATVPDETPQPAQRLEPPLPDRPDNLAEPVAGMPPPPPPRTTYPAEPVWDALVRYWTL